MGLTLAFVFCGDPGGVLCNVVRVGVGPGEELLCKKSAVLLILFVARSRFRMCCKHTSGLAGGGNGVLVPRWDQILMQTINSRDAADGWCRRGCCAVELALVFENAMSHG